MYLEILNKQQQLIFSKLDFTGKSDWYLAGGTALALYLGHRTSVDFDFYTQQHFKKGETLNLLESYLNKRIKFIVLRDFDDTFEIKFKSGIHLSLFYYSYPLVKKLNTIKGVKIASLEDICAMKLVAITQRGKRRDFVDMYYLIKKFGLERIFDIAKKKYLHFDFYNGLRGLLFFDDADNDKEVARIKVFNEKIRWDEIKKYIANEVRKIQLRG